MMRMLLRKLGNSKKNFENIKLPPAILYNKIFCKQSGATHTTNVGQTLIFTWARPAHVIPDRFDVCKSAHRRWPRLHITSSRHISVCHDIINKNTKSL